MLRRLWKKTNHSPSIESFQDLITFMRESDDFKQLRFGNNSAITVYYYQSLINTEKIKTNLLPYFQDLSIHNVQEIKNILPFDETEVTSDLGGAIEEKILSGFIAITLKDDDQQVLLMPAKFETDRNVDMPEIEFSVIGPKIAFIEDLHTNVNLIRKRIKLPHLQMKLLKVGKVTKTSVAIMYIDGIANQENIDTIIQRIKDIEYDQIIDSSFIGQMIADNSTSPFPQLMDTERPDRVTSAIIEGENCDYL
ncbi:spore germination protein [Gracilibacillus sp. JCM 18860]|uniref:spore germination protein n=1 Tax=Gracilibacillus sp. JCM 18860 TaxID=1306159 RepID=UPI000B178161